MRCWRGWQSEEGEVNYKQFKDWIDAQDPYRENDPGRALTSRQEIFDLVLAGWGCAIDSGWGLTDRDVEELWALRTQFIQLEEGTE